MGFHNHNIHPRKTKQPNLVTHKSKKYFATTVETHTRELKLYEPWGWNSVWHFDKNSLRSKIDDRRKWNCCKYTIFQCLCQTHTSPSLMYELQKQIIRAFNRLSSTNLDSFKRVSTVLSVLAILFAVKRVDAVDREKMRACVLLAVMPK